MEQDREDASTRESRFVLLTALLLLSASAGAAFGGVFRGSRPAAQLAAAAAAAVLVAFSLERRHVALATVLSILGLAIVAGIIVFPQTTFFGLPTASTLRAFVRSFTEVGTVAESHAAPSPPVAPLLLAAVTAVWTATFSSHVLAVRARSPFLAILPPGTLMAFTSLVVESPARRIYVGMFLIAALALLYGDGLRRIAQWGPLTQWRSRGRTRATALTTRGARRLALACLAIALVTPGILPGFRSKPLLNVRGQTANAFVSVDPIVDIRPALGRNPAVQLFTVWTNKTAYWRSISLDTFNGRLWTASDVNAENGLDARAGTLRGTADTPEASLIRQRFRFDRLNQPWLPAAFEPAELAIEETDVRFDPASSALVSLDGTGPGFTYDVTSRAVSPQPEVLDTLAFGSNVLTARYTSLPPDTPTEIYEMAGRLTRDYPTTYRKVLAIQAFLRTFKYNERAAPGHGLNDILYFLTKSREGYCEQFAGTMAVLLRALGIPSRVAVGFTPGTFDSRTGAYRVTTRNLHSWVEVLFPRFGWLPFEPTPSRSNPVASYTAVSPRFERHQNTVPPPQCISPRTGLGVRSEPGTTACGADGVPLEITSPDGTSNQPVRDPNARAGVRSARNPRAQPSSGGWSFPATVILGIVALLILVIPLGKTLWRISLMRRARGPRELVLAAYSVMTSTAADLGLGRRDDETIQEYSDRLKATVLFSDGQLDTLTRLVAGAAYGNDDIARPSADEAVRLSRLIGKEITRSREPSIRLLGLLRPPREIFRS
jgi:transglutaminase-like putative cysteine protease